MKKRALATILTICLALTLLPIQAAATSTSAVPSGYTGIYTAEDLDAVRNNLSGNYILMNDIDLSTWGNWKPIGGDWQQESSNFSGIFDGNGYSIFNMTITEESAYSGSYAGLFTVIRGATVKNIEAITGRITSQGKAALCAGAVCSEAIDSEIINCTSYIDVSYQFGEPTGDVIWTSLNVYCTVGGIAGTISGTTIENCCNFGDVSGISHPATMNLGGITAKYSNDSKVANCYNAGSLAANTDFATAEVGGIVGLYFTAGNSLQIINCYNLGAISCSAGVETNNRMGGILGSSPQYSYTNNIINCYYLDTGMPAVGYIAKDNDGNSHTTVTATALSRSAMQSQASFAGFDFSNTWMMGGSDYPYPVLRSMGQPGGSETEEVPAETLTVSLSTGTTVSEGTPVTVSWNAPSQAFRYYISAVNLTTNLYYVRDHILYDTSYDLSTRAVPLPSGEYEITVRAVDGNGNTVAESDSVRLVVLDELNSDEVFIKQSVTGRNGGTCTLASATMMLRRQAILDGDSNWREITESAVRRVAWASAGLRLEFYYQGMFVSAYPGVNIGSMTTQEKKEYFIAMLENHPEGIVIFRTDNAQWHAVLLTDYDETTDTFYCADPAPNAPNGRIPLAECTIYSRGTQDQKIGSIDQIWYLANTTPTKVVASSRISSHCPVDLVLTINGETLDSRTASGTISNEYATMSVTGTGVDKEVSIQIFGNNVMDYATDIELIGFDTGNMTFVVEHTFEDGTSETYTFEDVPISQSTAGSSEGFYPQSSVILRMEDTNNSAETTDWAANPNETVAEPANDVLEFPDDQEGTTLPFTDVSSSDWFYDAVAYVYENGLMGGTGNNQFSPSVTTTRAMIVTILHRLEGEPTTGTSAFTDVAAGQWYTDAVAWASANRIVEGYGNGRFGPNDTITREQMATILYRYAQSKGYNVSSTGDLSGYTDAAQVSDWAQTAMGWANAQGLITGNTATTLNPTGSATRAEVATILMRFVENVVR